MIGGSSVGKIKTERSRHCLTKMNGQVNQVVKIPRSSLGSFLMRFTGGNEEVEGQSSL
jgi:hypothetical protein